MRRALPLLIFCLLLVPVAHAQPATERILMDATFFVYPAMNYEGCLQFEPGQLSVTLQAVGDKPFVPTSFSLYMFAAKGVPSDWSRVVDRQAETVTMPIEQTGIYCYIMSSGSRYEATVPLVIRAQAAQLVAVRMTLTQ